MKLLPNISRVIFDSDLVATRLILAFAELLWAVMLFWPGDTFGRPTYNVMSMVLTELVWGFVFLTSSIIQLSIILYEQQNRDWAKVFANWNAVLWVFVVGAAMLSVYPPPAAMAGELSLACAAVWIWIRPLILDRAAIILKQNRRSYYGDNSINECKYKEQKDLEEVLK